MKGLDGMIRLSKWQLDEARKELAGVQAEINEIDAQLAALSGQLEKEGAFDGDVLAGLSFGAFAAATFARRDALLKKRHGVEKQRNAKEDVVREAFQELKKFEILAERQALRQKEDAAKRETAMLDEMGIQRHHRDKEADKE
ncbi:MULTISPECIES: flagellar export protein FliJ [unclassified Iodidimonas]|jgi:flagellar export protein FliJ|uniref:flagellar export protein FliJ n=1 Tax=unclassified Iodidimonas TaxID=2626145 RepID=UPI0024824A66|nr:MULTISPECIES: flagellar export protein FliJ [unclassified Iodidimonas]